MESWLTKLEGKAGREIDLRGRHSLYSATEKQSRGDTPLRYWEAKLGLGAKLGGKAGKQSCEAKLGSKTTFATSVDTGPVTRRQTEPFVSASFMIAACARASWSACTRRKPMPGWAARGRRRQDRGTLRPH